MISVALPSAITMIEPSIRLSIIPVGFRVRCLRRQLVRAFAGFHFVVPGHFTEAVRYKDISGQPDHLAEQGRLPLEVTFVDRHFGSPRVQLPTWLGFLTPPRGSGGTVRKCTVLLSGYASVEPGAHDCGRGASVDGRQCGRKSRKQRALPLSQTASSSRVGAACRVGSDDLYAASFRGGTLDRDSHGSRSSFSSRAQ